MTILRKIVAASVLAVALGGSALASDATEVGNPGMLLYSNGTMVTVKANSKAHTNLMAHAHRVDGGLIYASGGHLYAVDNVRMAGGQMLYDLVRDPAMGASER
jgi:hypothetical protein